MTDTAIATASNAEIIRAAFREGMPWVMSEYFERLRDKDTTSTEDLRKATELGHKVLADEKDKQSAMMTVHWMINNGHVQMQMERTVDVQAVEVADADVPQTTPVLTGSQDEPAPKAPEKPYVASFDVVANLIDDL